MNGLAGNAGGPIAGRATGASATWHRLVTGDLAIPFGFAWLALLVHLPAIPRYGWFRDELYYLACARHLDWGYVDHPPLSIAVLALVRAIAGESLWAVRLVPALLGALTVALGALIAREMGGGKFAQGVAALAVLIAPVFLAIDHYFSMNAFDLLFWAAAFFLFARLLRTRDASLWPLLGLVLGLGLLNKISVLWLGAGLGAALVLTKERAWLATPGPWIAGLIAIAMFAPHLAWQHVHGWPTLEFMHNATADKMREVSPASFVKEQVLVMHPFNAPLWVAGLAFAATRTGAKWRPLAIVYLAVAAMLVLAGRSRASYLAPAYPPLLALGAVALERLLAVPSRRPLRWVTVALMVAGGLATAPLAMPLLPPASVVRYTQTLGLTPRSAENLAVGALPQQFADMFGWEELAARVAAVADELTPEERARCVIFARNYGEAAALEHWAARYHLPRVVCPHNNYWLWGPGPIEPRPLAYIILGGDLEDNRRAMGSLEDKGTFGCEWCMPYERDQRIYLGRRPTFRLEDIWPGEKFFI